MSKPRLTARNYSQGLLVDDQLLAGIAENPEKPGDFIAFVLNQASGEYLGYESFPGLTPALERINGIERDWVFERTGGCGNTTCEGGKCPGCVKKTPSAESGFRFGSD
jgi:hypothetical protein